MSGFRPFVRQLGFQAGVQLNPVVDLTDGIAPTNSDQVFAMLGRFSRGRIDRPFVVNRSNLLALTGPAESIRASILNEAKLQAYEALNSGAYQAVLMRLAPAGAAKSWALVDLAGNTTVYSVAATVPANGYSLAVMDHCCHNDGIKLAVHADITPQVGTATTNPQLTLRVFDAQDNLRFEFTGSVDPTAKKEDGTSNFLPDIVASQTDDIEVVVATGAAGVIATSDAYGRGTDNRDKWATSGVLSCFSEGGTSYAATDYDRCIEALRNSTEPFGYLISGGTQALPLLGKLIAFAAEINTPIKVDLSGSLTPAAAITLMASLNVDTHYAHVYWAPLLSDDPLNGGKATWGVGGLNVGLSCGRNARQNAKGFAPKNAPVAGKEWPISRTGIVQTYKPTEQEISDLARARINAVGFEIYNGGGRYVFLDCLTSTKSLVSFKGLISVSEMASDLDNRVTAASKEYLHLPMQTFIKRMTAFLETLLADAQASGWLRPARNLDGAAFAFTILPSEVRPHDQVHIEYYVSYDGVARRVFVTQNLIK